jgi:hypothetical protein
LVGRSGSCMPTFCGTTPPIRSRSDTLTPCTCRAECQRANFGGWLARVVLKYSYVLPNGTSTYIFSKREGDLCWWTRRAMGICHAKARSSTTRPLTSSRPSQQQLGRGPPLRPSAMRPSPTARAPQVALNADHTADIAEDVRRLKAV